MTTEERLYKLEGIVEGVMTTLPGQVASLEQRMELLRQELRAEIADLRQEVKAEIAGLRQEMKAEINTALNRLMLYFTALAAGLALLTLFR
jgi:type VI protein secretion system component VasF